MATRNGIDYSKWDHFGDDNSDDDSNSDRDDNSIRRQPQVTRFDKPTQVTIGSSTATTNPSNSSSTSSVEQDRTSNMNDSIVTTTSTTTVSSRVEQNRPSSTSPNNTNTVTATQILPSSTATTALSSTATKKPKISSQNSLSSIYVSNPSSSVLSLEHEHVPSPKWIEKGGIAMLDSIPTSISNTSANGADATDITTTIQRTTLYATTNDAKPSIACYWTQDRATVTIRIPLDILLSQVPVPNNYNSLENNNDNNQKNTSTPKLHVSVSNLIPYPDRFVAVGQTEPQILTVDADIADAFPTIAAKQKQQSVARLLNVTLLHSVYLPVDDDDVDWTIETISVPLKKKDLNDEDVDDHDANNKKFVTIILYKASPMMGLTIWWKKPFRECEKDIDLYWTTNDPTNSSNAFQTSWKEAHDKFIANRQNKAQTTFEIP